MGSKKNQEVFKKPSGKTFLVKLKGNRIPIPKEVAARMDGKDLYMDEGKISGCLCVYLAYPRKSETAVPIKKYFNKRSGYFLCIPAEFRDNITLVYGSVRIVDCCECGIKINPGKNPPVEDLE